MTQISAVHISTEKGWRGGEQQVKLVTDGLVAAGHKVAVLAPPDSALYAERAAAQIGYPLNIRFGEVDPFAVKQIVTAALAQKAQLLHAQTSHAHSLGLRAARKLHIPLVVSRRVDFAPGMNWLSRRKYHAAEVHYIAISGAVKAALIQAQIPESRIELVYSGVDPNRYQFRSVPDAEARRQWSIPDDVPLIINIAALTDHKDQATLLRAAATLRDRDMAFRLVIAGQGELESELQQLQQQLNLQTQVQFGGYLKDVSSLYRAADVFVMSSHLEGLCTSILDAMSTGVPVVATSAGGIPEIITHEVNGLLAPSRNPVALADQLQRLLHNPEMKSRFTAAGRETILSKFTNQRMVEGTISAYHRILTAKPA